ncbi:methyl-accepting chemotaxis protein [Gellertiella hungarica]|uniref:Methyl-accepting chemotaxis protein n=1 Tax=Gellertiella hungarica TaxID=1572859 RepID=A0A7W6J7D7_9HYPH|nr:methyl-accepting chemotaxis protein [Gellertiella hungarica]MBB4066165.1 methyl-accepting chemotaxis protein [Gellertiella hungarica]
MFPTITRKSGLKLEALQAIQANVMIADRDLNITFMNEAVIELLKDVEADLRKELPHFSVDGLIGSNIDVFHKNPGHQRKMLAALSARHEATITIGPHVFDLIVTPLKRRGTVTGFVVEWSNARERLLNLDYAAQIAAIGRSQAIIEFTPTGEIISANANFLNLMGYTLDEIRGRPHRLFVERDYGESAEYAAFWAGLAAGQYRASEFRRLTKDGSIVVISGSYNPIFDQNGKVVKVVKFANDVTRRVNTVNALGDALTRLCAGDFGFQLEEKFAPEFEQLREDLNRSVRQLNDTFVEISRSVRTISDGSHDISEAIQNLSRRTESQAATLEETAAALDQITVNVSNSTSRAGEASQVAARANSSAEESGAVVANAVNAMGQIEESSRRISSIISVIDEIAFQTNLLALNAGVEAARAGEAGRGFAVVAQEVRELAQRSAKAAKEIKDLIHSSASEVSRGVQLVSETGGALKAINELIFVINDHMKAISVSSHEQSSGLQSINQAVNTMDQGTQQNAAMVEESSAASGTLAVECNKLLGMIAQFRLSERGQAAQGQSVRLARSAA